MSLFSFLKYPSTVVPAGKKLRINEKLTWDSCKLPENRSHFPFAGGCFTLATMGLIPYLEIDKEEKLVIVQEILPIEQAHKKYG
jgi:hypothetical protein